MKGGDDTRLVVVDLSNLCRDASLLAEGRPADLTLLDQFASAVARFDAKAAIRSVADRSLLPILSPADRRRARRLEQEGLLEFSTIADERLLDVAFGHEADSGTLIASLDNFDDFRRVYPEIQGCTDRFLGWKPSDAGLVVRWRDMGVHDHRRLSRKEESAQLKERRLRRTSIVQQAIATYFRCRSNECVLAQLWPDRLPDLPRYDDRHDAFVCPTCTLPLEVGANRPAASQVIVFLHGAEQFRILLEEGETLAIGRRDASGCLGLASRLPDGAAESVSRQHLSLSLRDGDIFVEDLGSRNGSAIRAGGRDGRLSKSHPVLLTHSETVVLPSGIALERSGRSLAFGGERPGDPNTHPDDGRSTRLLGTGRNPPSTAATE